MEKKSILPGTWKQDIFLIIFFIPLFLILTCVMPSEAEVFDYDDIVGELTSYEQYTPVSNDIIKNNGTIIGHLETTVYSNDTDYIYVLSVTPYVDTTLEFNMGLQFNETKLNGYKQYGYDFTDAETAFGASSGSGEGIFDVTIDDDNSIDWNVSNGYLFSNYFWQKNNTIAFYFVHTSAPETGSYNLSAAGSINGSAYGYVPVSVPVPGAFLLLGSCFLAFFRLKKFMSVY